MKAWLVVFFVALAGCADDADPEPEPTPEPNPTTPTPPTEGTPAPAEPLALLLDFTYDDCFSGWAFFPASNLDGHLPEGYTANSEHATALVSQCGNFTTPSAFVANTWLGMVGIEIEDPGFVDSERHFYIVEMFASEDVLGQLWEIAGYETIVQNGSYGRGGLPKPFIGTDNLCFGNNCLRTSENGLLEVQQTVGTVPTVADMPTEFAWYHEGEDYRLQWTGKRSGTATPYEATVELPDSAVMNTDGGVVWIAEDNYENLQLYAYP